MFSQIASHISEVGAPAMSVVGIVKGLMLKFVDTQCSWASWWLQPSHLQMLHVRPSHLQMLHVHTSPMVDHVWEKCPNNTNAVERKNRDAKDGVPVPIYKARTCQS